MCGLAGLFDSRGKRPIDGALLLRMRDALAHRGPDEVGIHSVPGLGFAHRRLSIIDLSSGQQPMFNDDRSVVIVFNGEIYNHRAVQAELEGLGFAFRTRSDTEAILRSWEAWGPACVDRLRGQFAIVIWDAARETLFMARDRLGEKPLHYAELPDGLVVFGSELKAVLEHPAVPRAIDPQAVEEFFAYGYVPDPRTIYRGIAKLPPAHRLTWRRGERPKLERYWRPRMTLDGPRSADEAAEQLIVRLKESVGLCLVSDVPVGAFLSGGVDSSGVVAHMAGQVDRPVDTFCIAFGGNREDESAFAQEIADRYRTSHHVQQVDPDALDLVDRLAEVYDEPFGDSSAIPTFRVCALARKHVKVALSGDAGDELFAGYRRYLWQKREEQLRALVPGFLRAGLFGFLGRAWPKLDWAPRPLRFKSTFQELAEDAVGGYFRSVSVTGDALRGAIFSPGLKRTLGGYHAIAVLRRHMDDADTDAPVARAQYADLMTWLPGDILVKTDRASMANSLEVRVPMLDHKFVEWAAALPEALRVHGQEKKFLLKKALEPYVPRHLLYRPKQGFSMPLAKWLRGPLAQRLRGAMAGQAMADSGLFDLPALARLAEEHIAGARDHSATLWNVLVFDAFLRREAGAVTTPTRAAALAV